MPNSKEMTMNTQTLFSLYKAEKADMDMPSDPFPTFKEWKVDFVIDWEKNHTMTEEEMLLDQKEETEETKTFHVKSKVTQKKTKKSTVTAIKKPKTNTKKQKAVSLYQSMMDGDIHPQRKAVIEAFIADADMTKAGASTYQYNIKKEFMAGKYNK